jgi:hypothetical protein
MTDLYAVRRANGDWFALEDEGRLRVPVFHSSHGGEVDFCMVNNPFASLKRGKSLNRFDNFSSEVTQAV